MNKLIPISKNTPSYIFIFSKFYNFILIPKINKLEYQIYYDTIKIINNKLIYNKNNCILNKIVLYIKTYLPIECYNLIYNSVHYFIIKEVINKRKKERERERAQLKIFAANYNILSILSGMGTLTYSS